MDIYQEIWDEDQKHCGLKAIKKGDEIEQLKFFIEGFVTENELNILEKINSSEPYLVKSDDGAIVRIDGKECKEFKDENHPQKYFRSLWITVSQG